MSQAGPASAASHQVKAQDDDSISTTTHVHERFTTLAPNGNASLERDKGHKSKSPEAQLEKTLLHELMQTQTSDDGAFRNLTDSSILWRNQLNFLSPVERQTGLHMAIHKHFLRAARVIVRAGANVNIRDGQGNQLLHLACKVGDEELVIFLLEHGANVGHADINGWYPLHFASWKGLNDVIPRLIDPITSNINEAEKGESWTPLNMAAYYEHAGVVETLLNNGAKLDIPDREGWTPLMTAVKIKQSKCEVLKRLLDHDVKDRLNTR